MKPDGSINSQGWIDLSYRTTNDMEVTLKAVAEVLYGRKINYSYLYGCSRGGRAVYESPQMLLMPILFKIRSASRSFTF